MIETRREGLIAHFPRWREVRDAPFENVLGTIHEEHINYELLTYQQARPINSCLAKTFSGRWVLVALDSFVAFTAIAGGIALVTGMERKRFSTELLKGTPFRSYMVPGLLLGVVVGGTSLVATVATLRSRRAGPLASALAGATLVGWIAGEACILPRETHSWIEAAYAGVGLAMTMLGLSKAIRSE
jgi:hypothetical protein